MKTSVQVMLCYHPMSGTYQVTNGILYCIALIIVVIPFNTSAGLDGMEQVCAKCGLSCNTICPIVIIN